MQEIPMRLRSQFPISEIPRIHDTLESIQEDVGIVPVVQAPFKLFYVLIHMLDRHFMESSDNGTLKQAPDSLNAVAMNIPSNPFFFGVVNGLMPGVVIFNPEVGSPLIGINGFCLVLHRPLDKPVKRLPLRIRDSLDPNFPAALDSTRNPGLIPLVSSAFALCLASYKRFVHFHDSDKRRAFKGFITHSLADPVAEIPGSLVGNSEGLPHLVSRDSLLGFTHEINGYKPLAERKVGIMHNGSAHYGELIATAFTLPAIMLWKFKYFHRTATGTVNTVRPTDVLKHLAAVIIDLKLIHQGDKICHGSKPP